jgi:hypothetical protein
VTGVDPRWALLTDRETSMLRSVRLSGDVRYFAELRDWLLSEAEARQREREHAQKAAR